METEPENQTPTTEEAPSPSPSPLTTSFPQGKIKRMMKLDRDIKKATSEATFAISLATELFIQFLTAGAHAQMTSRGRRIVRGEHVRSAVRAHQPTADFFLDCLLQLPAPSSRRTTGVTCQTEGEAKGNEKEKETMGKPLPRGTRRIDQFFHKTSVDADTSKDENRVKTSVNPEANQVEQ
ncbi:CCAAT-HAP5 transcription factor [Rhynchospora pubera]|uniref:CCAAT-HAP5 transcription factor n=1 Tax=Rhynchospora pubera TaxID=906938 RepID=A0AAV8CD02_9POAL|nr:CCAAT-HAP5 transcription factor [Rhynchospora pubera]